MNQLKIFLCGDVMTGRGIDQILKHPSDPKIHEGYIKDAEKYVSLAEGISGKILRKVDDHYIWGDAITLWEKFSPDLKIVNLETAITTNSRFFPKGINYRMHPDNTSVLSAAGIDICTLANNHILDWDSEGLKETISSLDENHILHAGAGVDSSAALAPAIFENERGRVLVFSVGHPSSGIPFAWKATEKSAGVFLCGSFDSKNVQFIQRLVEKYKKKDDVVILSIHWGDNWGYDVSEAEIKFAHDLIDLASVDIVHGHSSHHPRPIEIYKGHPIFYGCGDFINDYEGIGGHQEFRGDLTLMYFIALKTRPFILQKIELHCLKIKRFQLLNASLRDINWMLDTLNRESKPYNTKFHLEEGNSIVVSSVK